MVRKSLTTLAVEKMRPPARGQVDYFDSGFAGLSLRVSYRGTKAWNFLYRTGGKTRRTKLGDWPAMSLAEAREAWRTARKEVQSGRDPTARRPSTLVETVVGEWLERDQKSNRSYRAVSHLVGRYILSAWARRDISEITRRDVLDLVDGIADAGHAPMARRVLSAVHRLFRWCIRRGIVDTNPASDLERPGVEISRDRVLSDAELGAVWQTAVRLGWPHGVVVQLLILTGARRSEIYELRWSEIAGEEIRLSGTRTKTGAPHVIPLSPAASALLAECPRIQGSEYVFSVTGRKPADTWARVKADLDDVSKVRGWRIHDLRRTVATGLQRLGVPLEVTESVLGHLSGSRSGIVGVYQRYEYSREKRQALEDWAGHVAGLTR